MLSRRKQVETMTTNSIAYSVTLVQFSIHTGQGEGKDSKAQIFLHLALLVFRFVPHCINSMWLTSMRQHSEILATGIEK